MFKILLGIKRFLGNIRRCIYYIAYHFFKLFPIKNNYIIAINFGGKKYGDNPAAIIDKLLELNYNLKIYWVLDKKNYDAILPKDVIGVKFNSFKHFYLLAVSKIWLDNARKPLLIKKRKNQYYIQTWHGGFGFKRIEKDAENTLPKEYIRIAKNDSKNIDLLLTNSKWQEKMFRRCFYYDGKILVSGYPRNDSLFDKINFDSIKERVYKDLGIPKNTKTLLYAPTFRDDHSLNCYDIDYYRLLKVLKKKYDSNWKILIRLHPNISNMNIFNRNDKNIINVSKYPALNDLMIASDMLISDYSSIVFDYSYLSKPIILYASDVEQYANERGFLFTYDELPFPYAYNNDELEKVVSNYSTNKYLAKLREFYKKHGLVDDGNASERVAKIIVKKISE